MSKRLTNREKLLSKLNNFSDNEIGELLKYATTLDKGGSGGPIHETSPTSPPSEDELLVSLSAARENRRARQVFEWESVRRRVEGKAAIHRSR